ncbi:SacC protein [Mannheimia sp. USDA-ARS-USMARC-1261]|uniref:glycoside hydrolase family 32 protein n=1 Tax=Mannheimia sp. USDA-ARS-USMARC-1261 TaxID=1432056 RepID=UPI0003E3D1A6|nr:glycoside hydrolase family 32 protein [Mannheimia sp. USDA-ARS-USMARC-1261]AHG74159.1 SacC protein [Mannheimia sp. USDA-ARS-USMARC-1261]
MYIFNNGKYKSLHAQSEGELNTLRQTVLSDLNFYPTYHLAPETGLFNDPNGLLFDGKNYHIFAQWFPYGALHGMKHWQHFMTEDFQTFEKGELLIPDELFESHGCYSGGAILWQGKIVAFYTGNTRRPSDNARVPHQNIAIFDTSGKLLEKRCIIDQAPTGYTEHVRDPKPYITAEGKIRFVLGAQRENLTGTALIYEMNDLNDIPRLVAELDVNGFDNSNVFMWECPDLFRLGGKDLFVWSPQGKLRESHQFQNNYHATYAVGQLNGNSLNAEHIEELDYGFDFYAPQTVENSDRIMFGWVGLPDLTYPTDKYQWHSMLTMPRKLSLQNGKVVQQPIVNLGEQQAVEMSENVAIDDLDTAYLQISVGNQPLVLDFFSNEQGQKLTIRFENGVFSLDRSQSEQTELMEKFGTVRHCKIEKLDTLDIFFDRSVVEIFLNGGEKVLTSRFFIANRENSVKSSRPLQARVAKVIPISVE